MRCTRLFRRSSLALALATSLLVSGCDFDGAYDLPLPGNSGVDEDNAFEVTAEFRDVLNVVPRSPVLVDDVPVGEVTEVDRVGWNARVTMLVRDDVELPDNAIAEIRQTSLLGEKYVALEADAAHPSDGRLGQGDHIPLSATGRNPEVEEVLGALSFLLSGGGVGQLSTITQELNAVMSGREGRLKALLGTLDDVVATVDGQKADIIAALESVNGLAATLNAERTTVASALDVMAPAIAVLSDQHRELVGMLRALDRLGAVGTRVIGASKDEVLSILRDLEPTLKRLNEAGDSLPRGLSLMLSFPFPEKAREIVKGDYANTEIRLDVNLENFGTGPIPDPEVVISDLQKCLTSGSLTSRACTKFLTNLNLFKNLKDICAKPANRTNPVCKAVNALPLPGGDGALPGLPGLPDLPLLGGLPLLTGGARTVSTSELYGGLT